jgi:hypothetical protein
MVKEGSVPLAPPAMPGIPDDDRNQPRLISRAGSHTNGEDHTEISSPDGESDRLATSKLRTILPYCLALEVLSLFAIYHLFAPRLRLMELTICYNHYNKHDPSVITLQNSWPGYNIPEDKCKLTDIQQELSRLRGWGSSLEAIPRKP